jgi:lipopolysaccharide biosynthesis glycosyltransferase
MLESLMKTNKDIHFIAHTFSDDLSDSSIEKLKNTLEDGGSELVLHVLPEHAKELIQNAPTLKHISIATYYRLFLPYVIDASIRKVLYLDCDILVRRSVKGLFRKTKPETVIVGASDINEEDHADRVGVDVYVNTGVLTMDMIGIRKMYTMESMAEGIAKIMDQPMKILLGDQDIINMLFAGHIEKVSNIYNFQRLIHKAYCLKHPSLVKKTVIAHFITGDKPWKNEYLMIYAGEYYSYLRKYLTVPQRLAWWAGKPKGVKNMFDRHKEWVDLEKEQA